MTKVALFLSPPPSPQSKRNSFETETELGKGYNVLLTTLKTGGSQDSNSLGGAWVMYPFQ